MEETKESVTVDFDHHAPDYATDPYPTLEKLRLECPVAWTEAHDGYWVLTDFESVYRATREHEIFRSNPTVTIPPFPKPRPLIPQEVDAPDAQKWRRIVYGEFTPEATGKLEPQIYEIAHELIDQFIETGTCDFVADLAIPVPARLILRMLGFDETRWKEFAGWVHTIAHGMTASGFDETVLQAAMEFYGAIWAVIEDRKVNGLRDDIVSKLVAGEFNGRALTDEDLIDYTMLLLFGGLDTTSGGVGNALVHIAREPDLRRRLRSDRDLIPVAVEEFVRLYTPAQAQCRTLAHDVELHGRQLKAGERVLVMWAAANRDPKVFPNPDSVDLGRTENRHLGFGVGLHHCLGAPLGRTMFRIMLELVLERLGDYELLDDPDQHRYADAGTVYGLHSLPARFTPGPRRGAG